MNHTIDALVTACQEETSLYRAGKTFDPQYCLELFRHALVERNEAAWEAIYALYAEQVTRWVRAESGTGDPLWVDGLVNAAFMRFWQAVSAEKFQKLNQLGRLLQYLKMCAVSSVYDDRRKAQKQQRDISIEKTNQPLQSREPLVEHVISERFSADSLWQWVWEQLKDDDERIVTEMIFCYDLTPAQIYNSFPDRFANVKRVYRIHENVLRRLRRRATIAE